MTKSSKAIPRLIVLLAVAVLGVLICQAQTDPCKEANPEKRIEETTTQIERDPTDYRVFVDRAVALFQANRVDDAFADLDRAIKLKPGSAYVINARGAFYSQQARYKDAIADFTIVINFGNKDLPALYERGRSYEFTNEPKAAIKDFQAVIESDPENLTAIHALGIELSKLGFDQLAYLWWNRGVEILDQRIKDADPAKCNSRLYYLRGIILLAAKRFNPGLDDLNKAAELMPDYYQTYYYRGILYLQIRAYEQAVADLTRSIELNSNFAEAYRIRSIAYLMLKDKNSADADIKRYKELSRGQGMPLTDLTTQK
jgi:tetratricopeptide (TPR) repeat protein